MSHANRFAVPFRPVRLKVEVNVMTADGENDTLAADAKNIFLALNEVFKILKEEADSEDVKKEKQRQIEEDVCFHQWDFDYPIIALVPLGILCIALMSLVATKYRPKNYSCDAKIDVLVPLNVLTSYRNRARYVIATTLIVYPCYQLLMAVAFPEITASFLFAITRVAKIIAYGTAIYPIFVAINQKSLLSSAVGCVMSVCLLCTSIMPLRICQEFIKENTREVFARVPMMVCASAMVIVFIYDGWQHYLQHAYLFRPNNDSESFEDFVSGKLLYVKELLQKKQPAASASQESSALKRMLRARKEKIRSIWLGHKGFKYPTRVLCTYVSLLVLMYYLIYQAVLFERETLGSIDSIVHARVVKRLNRSRTNEEFFNSVVEGGELRLHSNDDYLQYLSHALTMFENCFYVSVAFSAIVHLLMLASMMLNYRDNVIRAYRGNFHHIMSRGKMGMPGTVVVGFTRYCGYQISFITYSFVFQSFAYAFFLFLGVQLFLLPVYYGYETPIFSIIERMWPTIMIASVLFISQIVVTRLFFVADRGRKLEILHRNAFFIWSYYLFLINALIGLIACLLRIFKAALIAFISMGRLDWCHLPGKFVALDPGYLSYVGQIHIDTLHSNPVMLAFVHYLQEDLSQRRKIHGDENLAKYTESSTVQVKVNAETIELLPPDDKKQYIYQEDARKRRVRRRWFILYSTLRNPSIIHLRKKIWRHASQHCLPMITAQDECTGNADKCMDVTTNSSVEC